METTLVLIACAVMGLLIGSFLTVVVDRVPRGGSVVEPPSACGSCGNRLTRAEGALAGVGAEQVVDRVPRGGSVVEPPSACGSCGNRLTAPDLVPIMSWVALRGRCRHCGTSIGTEPLIIESANAALFVLFGLKFGADVALIAFCILGAALVALVWIDLHEFRLPREITYVAFGLSAPVLVIAAIVNDEPERIWQAALGAGIALAFMGAVYLVSRGGMGDGDVRLAPLLGLHLGYLNPGIVPVGLFMGFVLGAVVGVAAMTFGSAGRKTALPFGPFLAAGTVLAVFIGQDVVDVIWQS